MKQRLFFILCICVSCASVLYGQNPGTSSLHRDAVTSASKRFVVQGGLSVQNLEVALWADEVLEKIETHTQQPVPFIKGHRFNIVLKENVEAGAQRVVRRQLFKEGKLHQLIEVKGYLAADQEDLLEALVGLLLNRYVVVLQDYEVRRQEIGRVPDWFSAGMAQALFPALRKRNQHLIVQEWAKGNLPELSEFIAKDYLPRGRWLNKAMSGMIFHWLESAEQKKNSFYRICFETWAKGNSLKLMELKSLFVNVKEEKDLLKQWDVWVGHRSDVSAKKSRGEDAFYDLYQKSKWYSVDANFAETYPGIPERISVLNLHSYSGDEWFKAVIFKLRLLINQPVMSHLPEGEKLQREYQNYLNACHSVLTQKKLNRSKRKELLKKAVSLNEAYDSYEESYQKQLGYLKTFEPKKGAVDNSEENDNTPVESADRAYLDQFEGAK